VLRENDQVDIQLLPSTVFRADGLDQQLLTSYLVNGTIALDAGSLGFALPLDAQQHIRHVLITHTHLDHTASLPIFLENVYGSQAEPVTVHGSQEVLDCLQRDFFNDRVWPDFIALSQANPPFLKLAVLKPGRTMELEGLRFTPVPVDHLIPTLGFLIEDAAGAVLIPSDTGPTEAVWELANCTADLKAVFLEVSFPNALAELARVTKHLTPAMFAGEIGKLTRPVPAYAVHLKANFHDRIVEELRALNLDHVHVAESGHVYRF
jgi:cAMP phosphodiesterase